MMASKVMPSKPNFMDSLQLPSEKAVAALSYYEAETWPKISQLITTHLCTKDIICSVGPMIEAGNDDVYKPWIVVRILPSTKYSGVPLDKVIKKLLIDNGYVDPQYNIHIEPGKQHNTRSATTKASTPRDWKNDGNQIYTDTTPTKTAISHTWNSPEMNDNSSPFGKYSNRSNTRSVKHLTCWYWFNNHGGCSKSESQCLYAHSDTGRYADQPRSLVPGGRAVAGRNAERIQANIAGQTVQQLQGFTSSPALAPLAMLNDEQSSAALNASSFMPTIASPHPIEPISFDDGLPADLAYSPALDEAVIRTPVTTMFIPPSVERLGTAKPTTSIVREASPAAQTDHSAARTSSGFAHGNEGASNDLTKLSHTHSQAAFRSIIKDSNDSKPTYQRPKYNPYTALLEAPVLKDETQSDGVIRSTGAMKKIVPKSNASIVNEALNTGLSFPATADRMTLLYSNMHSIMAARELCIGLDNDISHLESLKAKLSSLGQSLGPEHPTGMIEGNQMSPPPPPPPTTIFPSDVQSEIVTATNTVKDALTIAKTQRKRAQSIMKTEDNAKHVFGWKKDDGDNPYHQLQLPHQLQHQPQIHREDNHPSHAPESSRKYPYRGQQSSIATTVAAESDGETEVEDGGVEIII